MTRCLEVGPMRFQFAEDTCSSKGLKVFQTVGGTTINWPGMGEAPSSPWKLKRRTGLVYAYVGAV